jgi:ribonucleoside-diphosphate reductase beta chain
LKESLSLSRRYQYLNWNAGLMTQYFELYRLLVELGCDREYNTAESFDFMDMISLQGNQFFEKSAE